MSAGVSGLLAHLVGRLRQWVGRPAAANGLARIGGDEPLIANVPTPVSPRAAAGFMLAARLLLTSRLNPPKDRKARVAGVANRPMAHAVAPKPQQRETRHVWLAVRHSKVALAIPDGNVTPISRARRLRANMPRPVNLPRAA